MTRQSAATGEMARPKLKTLSGPFRPEGRNASLWRYSVVISLVLLVAALLLFYTWNSTTLLRTGRERDGVDKEFRVFGYEIVKEYPHDPDAFTQVRKHSCPRRMPMMCEWR